MRSTIDVAKKMVAGLLVCVLTTSCGDAGTNSKAPNDDKKSSDDELDLGGDGLGGSMQGGGPSDASLADLETRFLNAVGDRLSEKAEAFSAGAQRLDRAVERLCETGSKEDLELAQLSWKKLAAVWEQIELYQLGPLAENAATLRYQITNWPEPLNTCRIDMEVMEAYSSGKVAELSGRLNRQGLTAAEYLLFEKSLDTSCPSSIPALEDWKTLNEQQKLKGRCLYLKAVSSDVSVRANELRSKWGPKGQNPLSVSFDERARKAFLQEVFNRLFYVNYEMKYLKFIGPSGLDSKYCPSSPAPCPDAVQYPYADFSIEALSENLKALDEIIFSESVGLKDLLKRQGDKKGKIVAQSAHASIKGMQDLIASQDNSLAELLSSVDRLSCQGANEDATTSLWLCDFEQRLKTLASDIREQFTEILKLNAPQVAQGDND